MFTGTGLAARLRMDAFCAFFNFDDGAVRRSFPAETINP